MKLSIRFTHLWVKGFGWECTCFLPEDFSHISLLGENDKDGKIYMAEFDGSGRYILRDNSHLQVISKP